MKQFLVITTIYPPTESIEKFADLKDWQVVVVGDKKTPKDWRCSGVVYLPCEKQERLPYNTYARKMLGYQYAIKQGASVIAETDDDNTPYSYWGFPEEDSFPYCVLDVGFVNIYSMFTSQHIWPRGLPFHAIKNVGKGKHKFIESRVGVWQGLVNVDPDVDAIYRLIDGAPCVFKDKVPVVLEKNVVSPFNSQNTLFTKKMFPLLYLPVTVNQRFADILRGYVAQPIMWNAGYLLGFTKATVMQKRNKHDLMLDFIDEIPCYTLSEKAFQIVSLAIKKEDSIIENLVSSYKALSSANIVTKDELMFLDFWLKGITNE